MEDKEELLMICPNCDCNWGIEEMSFQECDCCGYPNNETDYKDIEEDYYDWNKTV